MTLREIPPRKPPPAQISSRALVLACIFSAIVWAVCIFALARAFLPPTH